MAHRLSADDLLATSGTTVTVEIPSALMRRGGAPRDGDAVAGDVVLRPLQAVSYTHLTLPTSDLV